MSSPQYPKISIVDGIRRAYHGPSVTIDREMIEYAVAEHYLQAPKPLPLLIVAPNLISIDPDAYRCATHVITHAIISKAAVVMPIHGPQGQLTEHLRAMLLSYQPPPFPIQFFADETSALEWLQTSSEDDAAPDPPQTRLPGIA